jgi:hypothetical protein
MSEFIHKNRLPLIFGVLGAVGGFLYWRFVGCLSGTCPIQSVWYWSTLWGTAVGYLIGDTIKDFINRKENRKNERTV